MKNTALLLLLCMNLTSCLKLGLFDSKSSGKKSQSNNAAQTNNSNIEENTAPALEIANFNTFPNSLISSMQLPSDSLDSVKESIDSLHVDVDNYTEFNQNNMVKIAYVACEKFLSNNPFKIKADDNQYKEKMVAALIDHFMSHYDSKSNAMNEMREELLSLYTLDLHDNKTTTSIMACAFAASNPYVTTTNNLCESVEGSCE